MNDSILNFYDGHKMYDIIKSSSIMFIILICTVYVCACIRNVPCSTKLNRKTRWLSYRTSHIAFSAIHHNNTLYYMYKYIVYASFFLYDTLLCTRRQILKLYTYKRVTHSQPTHRHMHTHTHINTMKNEIRNKGKVRKKKIMENERQVVWLINCSITVFIYYSMY